MRSLLAPVALAGFWLPAAARPNHEVRASLPTPPLNPNNPLKTIRRGERTEDEMCLAFSGLTFDRENLLPLQLRPQRQ